jgi:hypothetical protein
MLQLPEHRREILCTSHDSYSHTIGDADPYTNAYSYSYVYANSYSYGDRDGNRNAAAYANTKAASHSGTASVTTGLLSLVLSMPWDKTTSAVPSLSNSPMSCARCCKLRPKF